MTNLDGGGGKWNRNSTLLSLTPPPSKLVINKLIGGMDGGRFCDKKVVEIGCPKVWFNGCALLLRQLLEKGPLVAIGEKKGERGKRRKEKKQIK